MRGSLDALRQYERNSAVEERPLAVLELNANTGIGYQFAGYYTGPAYAATWSQSGGAVTGARFTTGIKRTHSPVQDGSDEEALEELAYSDNEDEVYEKLFSIKNIVKPHRPQPGIVKMAANGTNHGLMVPGYARYYPAHEESEFKYWRTPISNDPTSGFLYTTNSGGPFVYYTREFLTNKIKIVLQNYAGLPNQYRVQVLRTGVNGEAWETVWDHNDSAWPTNGIMSMYYYDDEWTLEPKTEKIHDLNNPIIDNAVSIRAVRLLVDQMGSWYNGSTGVVPNRQSTLTANNKVPLEVIEISARLALDISESVKTFDTDSSLAEDDSALPIGTITANTGSVSVEDYEQIISFGVEGSPLSGWEPKRSVIDLYFQTGIDEDVPETNRIFYGIILDAPPGDDATTVFQISDGMTILQDRTLRKMFTLNRSVTSIIQMILDECGISGFVAHFATGTQTVTSGAITPENPMIDYFYIAEQTAYEALADLAEAYQFSLVFDANNVLHMYSKEYIMKGSGVTPVTTLTYEDDGQMLANIKAGTKGAGKPINDIVISYAPHYVDKQVSEGSIGLPAWEAQLEPETTTVWQADEEILSCAPLVRPLLKTVGDGSSGSMVVDQEGGEAMDFNGYLQLNNEVLAYDAKEYMFRLADGSGLYKTHWLTSVEEYYYYRDRILAGSRMFFTGRLRIPNGGRGRFNTKAADHDVETAKNWPYSSKFNSFKFCPLIIDGINGKGDFKNNNGNYYWDYRGGMVYNVRGTSANPGMPTRNGAESCIRMTNAKEDEYKDYAGSVNQIVQASNLSGHGYFTLTPLKEDGTRPVPRRVGAGVRLLGRVSGAKQMSSLGVVGAGGVGMYMRYNDTSHLMQGWVLEIRSNVEKETENVRLYEIVDSKWVIRKTATVQISVFAPDVNTSVDTTDQTWTHLDLAFFPSYGGKPTFFGYVNGRAVLSYRPESAVNTSSRYGPIIRGDSYMDVDYLWWSDRSDPNAVEGFSDSSDLDPEDYDIGDLLEGAGGPPIWWSQGSRTLYKKGTREVDTFGLFEFGPLAHSVLVREAEFGDMPVINPQTSATRGAEFKVTVSDLNPFGGKMVIVNARRRAVRLAGDSAPFGIFGYQVQKSEEVYDLQGHLDSGLEGASTYEAMAEASKAIHGYSPVEIASDLIQTRSMARNMLEWVLDNCTLDCDVVDLEVFGNPLLEVGDKVRVKDSNLGYNGTEMFIITAVTQTWESGLTTALTLRRIN